MLISTVRNSLILKRRDVGVVDRARLEIDSARADAQQNPPTHLRINDFRNIDTRRRVLVNHRVDQGFKGVCDTVLTQRQ